jgi:hypothetical protein
MAERTERQGVGRRADDCEKCPDHSGMVEKDNSMLTWIKSVFAIVSIASGMMAYSVIWQAPKLNTSMAKIEERIDNIKTEMNSTDTALDRRVTGLEETVYKKK